MLNETRPEALRSTLLDRAGSLRVRHGFFTRLGGVSDGLYASLNIGLGSADDRDRVLENRRRVAASLNVVPERLVTVHQVHSPDVARVERPVGDDRPRADAMVTDRPGVALGISTADCLPVLFADADAGVIGAAHAGWKGALAGVLENTVAAMEALGAERSRVVAVLGPTISQDNYEVGPEFVDRFRADDAANERHFRPSPRVGHAQFDLAGYAAGRLEKAGVSGERLTPCTYADEEQFFSYRRATHRGEPDYGRQISAIVLEDR